eukprot:1981915-Amphidinium_carterae.1
MSRMGFLNLILHAPLHVFYKQTPLSTKSHVNHSNAYSNTLRSNCFWQSIVIEKTQARKHSNGDHSPKTHIKTFCLCVR